MNASRAAITQIHFSNPNQLYHWGPNVLAGDTIPAGQWQILSFPCHTRDMKFVDVHGRECILEEMYPCMDYPYDPPRDDRVPGAWSTMRIDAEFTRGCEPFGQRPIDHSEPRPRRLPRRD